MFSIFKWTQFNKICIQNNHVKIFKKKISETCFLYGPIRLELAERKGNGIGLDKVELEEKKEEDDGFVGMMDHTRERWMDIIFEKYGKKIVFLEVKVVRKMGCLGSFRM